MKRASVLVTAGMLAAAMFGVAPASAQVSGAHLVAPPDAVRHGMTYAQWEGAYQVWVNEIPTGKNPLVHPNSPRNCEPQPGKTVFVGASGAGCSVPSGYAVAFSTYFWECSTAEGLGETWRELRTCAADNFARDFDPDHTILKIDGDRVHHPRRWTFLTPGEIIDFPTNNIWGAEPGRSKSVTKGTLYILRGMSDGTHHIRLHVNSVLAGEFNLDYTLHVG